jgi:hypothetical protein
MNNSDEVQRLQDQLDEFQRDYDDLVYYQEEAKRLAVIAEEAIGSLLRHIYGWEMYG